MADSRKRGRKPKPTALKVLEGNRGKRPLKKGEPKPKITIPEPPAMLKGDALIEWKRITPQLKALRLLSKIDRTALALYCQEYATYQKAHREIKKSGEVIICVTEKNPDGYPMQSPYLAIRNKAFQQMMKVLTEFGMTPSSRVRLASGGNEFEDDMEGIL